MSLHNAKPLMAHALKHHYAVGSFSPRNTVLIQAVLDAAEALRSPVMVQISANEFKWFDIRPDEFAAAFYRLLPAYSIPVCLHLDHTKDIETVEAAIEAGFTSVMIDASALPFEENIAVTREAVKLGAAKNVSVEAELGQIGGSDKLETGHDQELYTKPEEAEEFVRRTGVDLLAVSVGTAHGVYKVKNPEIQIDLIKEISRLCKIPLVLHGGSGLPPETMQRACRAGISKINIATDLELAFHRAIGRTERKSNTESEKLSEAEKKAAHDAVFNVVAARMSDYLFSAGKADLE